MKTFVLFYIKDKPFLRQRNSLSGERLISAKAYDEHERLYIQAALPLIDPVPGKSIYFASEIKDIWQFRETSNLPWQEVSEPNFIGTIPNQYRQAFKLVHENSFQYRVKSWIIDCFGEKYASDIPERNYRFIEEAIEMVQALGMPKNEVLRMVVRAYDRPTGDPSQEAGGVLVTLAGLCSAAGIDMLQCGENAIEANIINKEAIKLKHSLKQKEGVAK